MRWTTHSIACKLLSQIATLNPFCKPTVAMPVPIVPAPKTVNRLMGDFRVRTDVEKHLWILFLVRCEDKQVIILMYTMFREVKRSVLIDGLWTVQKGNGFGLAVRMSLVPSTFQDYGNLGTSSGMFHSAKRTTTPLLRSV